MSAIRRLEILAALTGIISCVAFVIAVIALENGLNSIQTSRLRSVGDTCFILREIVIGSARFSGDTPAKLAAAHHFNHVTGLDDCHSFALHLVK